MALMQRKFRRIYHTKAPARNSVLRWVGNFQTTGRRLKAENPTVGLQIHKNYNRTYIRASIHIQEGLLGERSLLQVCLWG